MPRQGRNGKRTSANDCGPGRHDRKHPENMGTYDFVPPGGINTFIHGVVDVIPWIMWGNSENDRTSIGERLLSIGKGIINKSTDYFADEE